LVRDVRETHGQTAIILDSISTGGETEEHTTIAVPDQRGDLPTEKSLSDVPTTADRSDSQSDAQAVMGVTSDLPNTKKEYTIEDFFCQRYSDLCPINTGSAEWDEWVTTVGDWQYLPEKCSSDQSSDMTEPNEAPDELEYGSQGDVYGKFVELEEEDCGCRHIDWTRETPSSGCCIL
jgi:hypothetical protein